ncbi:unnamed protein product, partial [Ixodes pacificus]
MGMVDSSLDREELDKMSQQANTDFLPAESPASFASTPSDRGESRHSVWHSRFENAKRKRDQETVEQELLKHLNTKMTGSELLGYLTGAAIQHWDTETYALFTAKLHRPDLYHEQIQGAHGNHEGTLQLHKRIST